MSRRVAHRLGQDITRAFETVSAVERHHGRHVTIPICEERANDGTNAVTYDGEFAAIGVHRCSKHRARELQVSNIRFDAFR